MIDTEIAEKVIGLEAKVGQHSDQIADLHRKQDQIGELVTAMNVFKTEQDTIKTDVRDIKADVRSIREQPVKRMDGIVDKLIAGLVGAFLAWLLAGGTV